MLGKKTTNPQLFYTSIDWDMLVPAGSFYRVLKEKVDFSFVRGLIAELEIYGDCGQKSIDPEVFFKLQLVSYIENLTSDRKLIELSSQHLGIRYFLNYDINEPLPFHSTISRTRHRIPESVFEEVFYRILVLCIKSGLVSGEKQLLDSSLIKANASLNSLERVGPEVVAKSLRHELLLKNPDQSKSKKKESDQSEDDEQGGDGPQTAYVKPDEPARKKDPLKRSNKHHYSLVDPDARIAKKPSAPSGMYYLSQLVVDSRFNVITHIEANHADFVDSKALAGIVDRLTLRLLRSGLRVESIAADSNYSAGRNYRLLENRGIKAYIPFSSGYKEPDPGFVYDSNKDCYRCPKDKVLHYCGVAGQQHDQRRYATQKTDCKDCPPAANCLNYQRKERRSIIHQQDYAYSHRARQRLKTPEGSLMMRLRKSCVEPAFGTLKKFLGMRQIRARGLQAAHKEMLMAAVAYNLLKYIRKSGPNNRSPKYSIPKLQALLGWGKPKTSLRGLFGTKPQLNPELN